MTATGDLAGCTRSVALLPAPRRPTRESAARAPSPHFCSRSSNPIPSLEMRPPPKRLRRAISSICSMV